MTKVSVVVRVRLPRRLVRRIATVARRDELDFATVVRRAVERDVAPAAQQSLSGTQSMTGAPRRRAGTALTTARGGPGREEGDAGRLDAAGEDRVL